jgi:mono/diheme cytochrome c family protein
MKTKNRCLLLWLGLLLCTVSCSPQKENKPRNRAAEQYLTFCSGCHGQQMEGGSASALIKDVWQYGSDRASLIRVTRDGIPGTEMGQWKVLMTEEQIAAVADYILRAQR